MKGDDKAAIDKKTQHLTEVSGKLAERLYAQNAGAAAGDAGGQEQPSGKSGGDDDVVDAEFEEVKDDKK
jgi:molecular chaperone DnaK